ncbi:MAG: cation diffusion facilitator family transporter [Verrucomicrobiota bacterium]
MEGPHHQHGGHTPQSFGAAFAIGIALNTAFVIVEVFIGLRANSMALVADGVHNFADVISLVLAGVGYWFQGRTPSGRFTYGYGAVSIQSAVINAFLLVAGVTLILWESIGRLRHPEDVPGGTLMVVAGIGILINGATALLFMKGSKGDINIRGAFVHMAADAGVSLGVVVAGGIVLLTGWTIVDPLVGIAIAIMILVSSRELLTESLNLALHAAPKSIDLRALESWLLSRPGVDGIHDLHVWPLSTNKTAMSAHLQISGVSDTDALLHELSHGMHEQFDISHTTIQTEESPGGCGHCCIPRRDTHPKGYHF